MLTQNSKRSTVTHDVQSHRSFHFEPLGQIRKENMDAIRGGVCNRMCPKLSL